MSHIPIENMTRAQLVSFASVIGADIGTFYIDTPLLTDSMIRRAIKRKIAHDAIMFGIKRPDYNVDNPHRIDV